MKVVKSQKKKSSSKPKNTKIMAKEELKLTKQM